MIPFMEVIVPVLASVSPSCHTLSKFKCLFEAGSFGKCPVVDLHASERV